MLETAIYVARRVGRLLAQRYTQPHRISVKGLRNITTEADTEAEELAIRLIRQECPEALFVSEETNERYQEAGEIPVWYIDPLDGTTNFARGIPTFSISIAMALRGQVQCGVVYDPLTEQLFYAERGQGAYLNGRRLRVSSRKTLLESVVFLDWPREPTARQRSANFLAKLAPRVDAVRSRGSAALSFCAIAAGWAEIYYQYTLYPWDVAAGALIVEEAGGKVTDLHGRPYTLDQPDWLATNGLVHEATLALDPYA